MFTIILEIAITFVLILANGFFSGSEIAVVSARRSRLQQRANSGDHGAVQAIDLAEHPDRFLATVQIGITLISTIAAAFGGARISEALAASLNNVPALVPVAAPLAFVVVVGLITYFSLVLGELVPKRFALQHADELSARVAPFMTGLSRVTSPIIALLSASSNAVLRLFRQQRSDEVAITEEDILYLTTMGTASGTVEAGEAQLIRRAFRFTDRVVRQVMTPRADIFALDVATPIPEMIRQMLDAPYTRVPLYAGTLDDLIGILYVKDMLRAREEAGADEKLDLRRIARPPIFVLEHQHAADILPLLQHQSTHVALVVDEYGQVTGLMTLEDVLEELVGDIADEYGSHNEHQGPAVSRLEDNTWIVDGSEAYESIREQIGNDLLPAIPDEERGEYTSVAGIILARLGRIPTEGDTVRLGEAILEVVKMDGRRIDKVLIYPSPEHDDSPDATAEESREM
ncbi:MAG TPA: hemolysin family protein [Ktedonobacterales bacterium]